MEAPDLIPNLHFRPDELDGVADDLLARGRRDAMAQTHDAGKLILEAARAGEIDMGVLAKVRSGRMPIAAAAKAVRLKRQKDKQAQKLLAAAATGKDLDAPAIYLADAFEWTPKQPKCDLLLTDPPYGTDVPDIATFAPKVVNLLNVVKPTGRAYICIGSYPDELRVYLNATVPEHMRLVQVLVWTFRNRIGRTSKEKYIPNWHAVLYYAGVWAGPLDCPILTEQFAVQDVNAPDGRVGDRYHAWQKPDDLAERFICQATKPGDTVLDPFACSGTFVLAAKRLGRIGVGCEISEEHLRIALGRGCRLG